MLRKTIIALAAITVAALTLPAGDADARPFHRGGYHGRAVVVRSGPVFVHRGPVFVHRRAFVHRRIFVRRAPILIGRSAFYGRSCWRLVPTAFGLRRVWVCPRYWAYRRHWGQNLYVGIQ